MTRQRQKSAVLPPSSKKIRTRRGLPVQQWLTVCSVATGGSPAAKMRLIRSGVAMEAVVGASYLLEIALADLAAVLWHRRPSARHLPRSHKLLATGPTEQLIRLAQVACEAEATFGSPRLAGRWLLQGNLALGGATPLSILDSQIGAGEVSRVLAAIRYGGVA